MDKLELDARVARLERRVGLLMTALFLAATGGVVLMYLALGGRADAQPAHATVATPASPPHIFHSAPAPDAFMGGMGMMMNAEGTMAALHQKLATLKQLREEGVINEQEWQAKKTKELGQPLNPGELRTDLEAAQRLYESQAISEDERADLRATLLGLG
jgi:hypothetical protein